MQPRPYPSDLSDREWSILAPLLVPGRQAGHPRVFEPRRIADAVFYLLRTGCQWRALPHEFPPWPTVYYHSLRRHGTPDAPEVGQGRALKLLNSLLLAGRGSRGWRASHNCLSAGDHLDGYGLARNRLHFIDATAPYKCDDALVTATQLRGKIALGRRRGAANRENQATIPPSGAAAPTATRARPVRGGPGAAYPTGQPARTSPVG